MESKNQTVASSDDISRPLANFHPSIWGTRFLHHSPDHSSEAGQRQLVEELKEEVKRELKEASNDYTQQLRLVDAIQRLGVAYHFEHEIDQSLQDLSKKFHHYCEENHDDDLYAVSLGFRLLRQHGYRVSCKIFDKFKDDKGDFKVPTNDINVDEVVVLGMVEFFEATHLRVHGEQVLDQGYVFSRNYLESALPNLKIPVVAEQVNHALNQYPNRRGLARLEARHYISIYDQFPSHHRGLLKLAKLDFNLLQSLHKSELAELMRWWQCFDVPRKLFYARDRMVETYFWGLGVYFEPEYAFARKILIKVQGIISLIDDTFDAYGTFEELQIFAQAIDTWSLSCLDQLPDYMKAFYKALLDVFEEIEDEMAVQGRSYRISNAIETIKVLVRNYLAEAKWREEKYKPNTEEYMRVAKGTSGYTCLITTSFVGMGDVVSKESSDWVLSHPDVVTASLIICRLRDDMVGHEFERKRDHIPSSVECYTEEHAVTEKDAVKEFNDRLESAWKDINEGFLRPTKIPAALLDRVLNFSRVIEVMYGKGDWYTEVGPGMQSFIKQLFVDPVPLPTLVTSL